MIKIPAGMIVKQIIDEKKLKAADVGLKMGISRQAVYQSYAKMIFSEGDIAKWSSALGVSTEDFVNRWNSGDQSDDKNNSSNYLMEHLTSLEDQFKKLTEQSKAMAELLQNQLAVKDRQIQGLQQTVEVLLGKSDPAPFESIVKKMWDDEPMLETA